MDHQSPQLNIDINVTNLPLSVEARSTVVMRVENLENQQTLTSPQLFNFEIDNTTNFSQIFGILYDQHQLNSELSLILASEIIGKAGDLYYGGSAIIMTVFVQISDDTVLDSWSFVGGEEFDFELDDSVLDNDFMNFRSPVVREESDERDNGDMVEKLVRDGLVGKGLGLEKESCVICLENFKEDFEKVPTQMVCSHIFHDRCISQWLRGKSSCPLCRRVLLER